MIKLPALKIAKILTLLKWGKIIAKIAAIGTTISGAITAATSSSVTTGFVLGATGTTTYVAIKTLPGKGYEKAPHVPPTLADTGINRSVKLYNPSQTSISPYNASNGLTGKRS